MQETRFSPSPLKLFAVIAAIAAACCFGVAAWWFGLAWEVFHSEDYAGVPLFSLWRGGGYPSDPNGGGVFAPAALALVVAAFLARFAWNLWHHRG
ncbi:MAG: hypothetical protein EOO24_24005 [Comamonadaceae bacterium]|nr:MAG: hypothetical protein EOO24_24005 [Comamonadaceae bacterium]